MSDRLNDYDSFSIFHNNLISLSKNFENLQSSILDELGFNFNIIGITETKINDSNSESTEFSLPGYEFEFVPTPLAFGGVYGSQIVAKFNNENRSQLQHFYF